MAVNINTDINTVRVTGTAANIVKIIGGGTRNLVTVSQPITKVVKVATAGPKGPPGPIGASFPTTTRKNANNSTNSNINYCGVAPGTNTSESLAVWTIQKIVVSSNGEITTTTATDVAWIDRESAIYI